MFEKGTRLLLVETQKPFIIGNFVPRLVISKYDHEGKNRVLFDDKGQTVINSKHSFHIVIPKQWKIVFKSYIDYLRGKENIFFLFKDKIIRKTHVVKIACNIVVYVCRSDCLIISFLNLLNLR